MHEQSCSITLKLVLNFLCFDSSVPHPHMHSSTSPTHRRWVSWNTYEETGCAQCSPAHVQLATHQEPRTHYLQG